MMKDTPQGQTNHCPICEDAAKRIEELECRITMLANALNDTITSSDVETYGAAIANARQALNATSAQSSAWLNKKHVEWIGRPIAEVKDIEIVWLRKFGDGYLYAIPSLEEKKR